MSGFTRPWGFAGGWAIDLFANRLTRTHHDIEIAILRDHQMELRDYLRQWRFSFVIGEKLVKWDDRQMLMLPIHELHLVNPIGLKLEVLLNESDGIDWIYRREARIRLNLSKWIGRNSEGIPSLAPEIVLLYKSKNPRSRDEMDLRSIVGLMSNEQRAWLIDSLVKIDPAHEWINICRVPESVEF